MSMSIYISSTSEDLADHRSEAMHAILSSGHRPVAMEHYAAEDVVPI
ncbi:MAG: DUF4062 domain-containing protein, partial [Armatimonadota bacterium]